MNRCDGLNMRCEAILAGGAVQHMRAMLADGDDFADDAFACRRIHLPLL